MSTFTVYQTSTVEPQFTHVIAEEMTDTHFSYRCDCRLKSHRHGNGRDLTNRHVARPLSSPVLLVPRRAPSQYGSAASHTTGPKYSSPTNREL